MERWQSSGGLAYILISIFVFIGTVEAENLYLHFDGYPVKSNALHRIWRTGNCSRSPAQATAAGSRNHQSSSLQKIDLGCTLKNLQIVINNRQLNIGWGTFYGSSRGDTVLCNNIYMPSETDLKN